MYWRRMNNVTFKCGECSTETAIVDPSCNLIKCSECKDVFDWKTGASVDMGDSQLTNCPRCGFPNTHIKKNTKPVCLNCHTIYNTPKINSTETKDEDMEFETKMLTGYEVKFDMNTTPSIRVMSCISQIFSEFKLDIKNQHAVAAWINAQYGKESE